MRISDDRLISESKPSGGWRVWLGLAALAGAFIALVFATKMVSESTRHQIERSPFLQVTNRDFSLFLWQNPEFMRPNRKKNAGYLAGFQAYPQVTPIPEQADSWVSAPPDILFLYHAWERLLSRNPMSRQVETAEFLEFLDQAPEWRPMYWKGAPAGYSALITALPKSEEKVMHDRLPDQVLRAFIGWKNYYKEGEEINDATYTVGQIRLFLQAHPHYSSNYWRSLYPGYLQSLHHASSGSVPSAEIPSFLKVALYNHFLK